jgi:hypothetical protein
MSMPDSQGLGRENIALGDAQSLLGTEDDRTVGATTDTTTREQVRQAKDKVVDTAKSTFREARDRAGSTFAQGRRQAADQLGGLGSAFHQTSEHLRGEDQTRIADLADSVGREMDRAADYLRQSDGRTIARDLEGLARRQPALVFAGAFALGVVAARFLKSSERGSDFEAGGGFDAPA